VFSGTRIPVAALFQNMKDGVPLAEFVEIFPGVTTEQSLLVLEHFASERPNSHGLQQGLVVLMGTNPEPHHCLVLEYPDGPPIQIDPG
jgi:hypothetical protein